MDMIPFVIIACTVLHNICLQGMDENIEEYILEGLENEVNDDQDLPVRDEDDDDGVAKRNYLVTFV